MEEKKHNFVVCVNNKGYEASLQPRKIYESISDGVAEKHNQIRIIDESGGDYLFPVGFFVSVDLPENVEKAIVLAAQYFRVSTPFYCKASDSSGAFLCLQHLPFPNNPINRTSPTASAEIKGLIYWHQLIPINTVLQQSRAVISCLTISMQNYAPSRSVYPSSALPLHSADNDFLGFNAVHDKPYRFVGWDCLQLEKNINHASSCTLMRLICAPLPA